MDQIKTLTCANCKYEWRPRKPFDYCPHCKSRKQPIGEMPPAQTCKRCDYEWIPRIMDSPTYCPKCGSTRWNVDALPEVEQRRKQPSRNEYNHEDFMDMIFSPEYD